MFHRCWTPLSLCAVAALAAACSSPPKEPIFATPEPTEEPPPPPPPKPKPCKALDEDCEAKASTEAKIANSDMIFKPPKGWKYAQGELATIAQTGDDGVVIAITEIKIDDPKQEAVSRKEATNALAEEVKVTLPKKEPNWKKPDDSKELGDLKLNLWQVNGGMRAEKKGAVLFFTAAIPEGKLLVGVSFSTGEDEKADGALLECLDTIAPSGK